jgi:precorrin-6Y C5,15-methyltransferase (decarboxylating)
MAGEAPWRGRLAVVGIGLDGPAGMSARGRRLLEAARTLVGHPRHLALLAEDGRRRLPWDGSPDGLEALLAGRDVSSTVLVASGDPNLFGIGASLLRRHGRAAVAVEPAVSSLQLALARAGVPAAGAALLSAHGRTLAAAVGPARHARRAAFLTDPEHDPAAVVRGLAAAGVEGGARVVVAERLGGPEERVREGTVAKPPPGPYDPLAVVVLERPAAAGPGLGAPESAYVHESGLITKAEVRAVVLAALDVAAEDVVWDLGSGSGSVAVEAGRMAGWGAVYAVERDPERAAALERNLARHGSWNVEVVRAEAGRAMARLPAPDAVFIGGGGAALKRLVEGAVAALRRRQAGVPGRLVAALATLESTLDAVEVCQRLDLGWRLAQVQVSRARAVGGRLGWEALNPVQVLAAEVPRG